ncbi:MAG TPA: flagellar basal body L-ring protein FlgH [Bryobacteraceae bacterium]|jgi:flagellar L-ring protein precursor FlgH|nr:flagellar basal body L-ring protein FlgH [Bryobacteraceae bacterium]
MPVPIRLTIILAAAAAPLLMAAPRARKPKVDEDPPPSIAQYIQRASRASLQTEASPGSLFVPTGLLADAARDLRASRAGDVVTILVSDNASAVSSGVSNTSRKSDASASVSALAGIPKATALLPNLLGSTSNQQLQAQGTTSRQTTITTRVTTEVVAEMPNGNLVLEGKKWIGINSERQQIVLRGIIRPQDLAPDNSIPSDRVAQLELFVNGKGIVADSIKRPFILYRILLGLLPF